MHPGHCRMPTSGPTTGKMRFKICGLFLLTSGLNAVDESADYNRHCQSETECTDNEGPVINTYTQHTSVHLFVLYHGDKHSHFLLQNVRVCQVVLATLKKVIKGTGRYSSSWEPNLRAMGRQLSYGITQCYLPPDTIERAPPNHSHAGWYLIYLSRVDLVDLIVPRPGVEPAGFQSQV